MLNSPNLRSKARVGRNLRRERRYWHESKQYAGSLGCAVCPDGTVCGGLHIDHHLFNCLDHCCGNPENCDSVCRNKPKDFPRRVREIGGFKFDNIPRSKPLPVTLLSQIVPILYNGNRRHKEFSAPMVCLPLYQIITRQNGKLKWFDREKLIKSFCISDKTQIILTGTAKDSPLERWWALGQKKRLETIRFLREVGVKLVTTPNYSLFTDQPRWGDLHSMKRIAIVHEEFLRAGMPAALHVNARTDRDWERWTEYIQPRTEVTHIAFEYKTGAGWAKRIDWQTDQLVKMAKSVDRPLHLVVRGASRVLLKLRGGFEKITLMDTTTFVKTVKRQSASISSNGKVKWEPSPTPQNAPLDELLDRNWSVIQKAYNHLFTRSPALRVIK